MSHDPEWPQANAVPALCSQTSKLTSHTAERKSIEDRTPGALLAPSEFCPQAKPARDGIGCFYLLSSYCRSHSWCLNLTLRRRHPYLADEDSGAQGTWLACGIACGRTGTAITLCTPSFCLVVLDSPVSISY